MRVHPDTYPARLTSFIAQTPSGIPQWFDWDDATTPRTDRPARFVCGLPYTRSCFGLEMVVVPYPRVTR